MIAPGLFSTMTRQPSLALSSLAKMRPMMSGGVPAGLGTTIRIMFEGYCCAELGDGTATIASASIPSGER